MTSRLSSVDGQPPRFLIDLTERETIVRQSDELTGVIGRRKFIYDLWGDTVNIASRMESHGVVGRVQVTDATRQQLGESFLLEERGLIAAKGIGDMHTWLLIGRSAEASG